MKQRKAQFGFMFGAVASCTALILAVGTVAAGDLRIQTVGLDVSLKSRTEQGFVINIAGAECPGAGCPLFALNWSLAKRG